MGKKVLIVKLASLGDLVHALPAVTDAMVAYPDTSFDWVVDKNFQQIPLWHPAVKNVFPTNHRVWRKDPFSSKNKEEMIFFYKTLKKQRYDLIIDAHGGFKSALISRIPKGKRSGWDGNSIPEWGAHFLYNSSFSAGKNLHAIERIRLLFAGALDYLPPSSKPDYRIRIPPLETPLSFLPDSPYLIFVPIASYSSKLWEETSWKDLMKKARQLNYQVLLPWGSLQEKERAERLAEGGLGQVLPKLSLNILAHVLKKAKAMVCVDTGLSHIAAALEVPNITLYGPTNPHLTGTIGEHQMWITSDFQCPSSCKKSCTMIPSPDCHAKCLSTISPGNVWDKLVTLL